MPCAWVLFAAGFGCNESGLTRLGSGRDGEGVPDIAVEPASVDFGTLSGVESARAVVTIQNVGSDSIVLDVNRLRLEGGGSFSIVDPPPTFGLLGGESRDVTVTFSPETPEEHRATLAIESNDPDEPVLNVPIVGSGRVPELEITPDPLEIGTVTVGCDAVGAFTLRNIGTFPLSVSDIGVDGGAFALGERFVFPFDLAPGGEEQVDVRFIPDDERIFEGRLRVASNEAIRERTARHVGVGVFNAPRTDRFVLPVDPPADLLMFVDQSWSMRDDQDALAANFASFIAQIDAGTPDWHLMVANGDDGCTNSGVLTRDTLDYTAIFESSVRTGGGSLTESGLSVVATALEKTSPGECNEGFLREDALLHVIFVTDEAEQSSGAWEDYLARMRAAKGTGWLLRASAVAGELPDGCKTLSNSANAGRGYYEVVQATSGAFLSICSAWGDNVSILADATIRRDTFPLSRAPDPTTVQVTVNGAAMATGWRWEAEPNTIVFETAYAPTEGDVVEITYTPPLPCGG